MNIATDGSLAKAGALILLAVLCGCTAAPWEHDFWVPPAATGAAPITEGPIYPIRRAEGNAEEWPNLGDVPEREPLPRTLADQQAGQRELEAIRASAQAADAVLRTPLDRAPVRPIAENPSIPVAPPAAPAILPE